jgi:hypothetical protein
VRRDGLAFAQGVGLGAFNTMGTDLCLEALEKALNSTGKVSGIFNTDQGFRVPSAEWTGRLTDLGVKISMDGKGRWMDNVFIERHGTPPALRGSLEEWFDRYNHWRPYEKLGNLTPAVAYQGCCPQPRKPHEPPRRAEFGSPPLQASHSTALHSVACCAFRYGSQNSSPSPFHP